MRVFPSQKSCADSSLSVCPTPACMYTHAKEYSRTRVKHPVVHVRVSVNYGNTKRRSMHFNYLLGLGSATLLQLAFLGGKRPDFPISHGRNSHWDNKVLKKQKHKNPCKTAGRMISLVCHVQGFSIRPLRCGHRLGVASSTD